MQDIDYGYKQVTVRNGKGMKDRINSFPQKLEPLLRNHLERVKEIHDQDLETTMFYTHVLKQGSEGVISPLDDL